MGKAADRFLMVYESYVGLIVPLIVCSVIYLSENM